MNELDFVHFQCTCNVYNHNRIWCEKDS